VFYYSGVDNHEESVDVVSTVGQCLSIVKRRGSVRRVVPMSFIPDILTLIYSWCHKLPQISRKRPALLEKGHKCGIPGCELSVGSYIFTNQSS
jgi:hypothetical protein